MYGYYTLELEIDTVLTCFDKLHTSGTPLAPLWHPSGTETWLENPQFFRALFFLILNIKHP